MNTKTKKRIKKNPDNFLTISEFRHKVGLPLVVVKKLAFRGEIKAVRNQEGKVMIDAREVERLKKHTRHPWKKFKLLLKALGPGVITGASDDDPSGIGTYSSVGAKFGFSILWMAAWLLPMMLAVQEICARIGIVTGQGLAGVIQKHYKKSIVSVAVFILVIANIVNIGADLGAMAASLQMLTGINFYVAAVAFALIVILMEVFIGYHLYVKVLKWLTISVLAYVVAGFLVHPDWVFVLKNAFTPEISFTKDYIFAMIAVFGTSITPYLFFWQASEEVEENAGRSGKVGFRALHQRIRRMRTDVGTGMVLANVVFFFIVLTTAQTLFKNGITDIQTAQQAAEALLPFGQGIAYYLFAFGIIGTGLLAVPILAGSGAYALAEIMNWQEGLEKKLKQAKGFYFVIAMSILCGLGMNFLDINPIKALYYSAYLNGLLALPLLIIIMLAGNNPKIMGRETHPTWVKIFGWMAVFFMIANIVASLVLMA